MFYPVDSLKKGGRFYLCWVADSWPLRFATITHRQLWSQDIRKICDDLLQVIMNESGRPTQRFSLRLSSQITRGLVRLYQRKVDVFLGNLCMINANVSKHVNKKLMFHEEVITEPLPRLLVVDIEREQNVEGIEEMLQRSGNIVANIENITLREEILPAYYPVNDNFGELHPDQPLQMLMDRTIETMMAQETSVAQHSLELPALDFSADKSHDRSRLPRLSARMERVSEHEMTMFRKSKGEDLMQIDDTAKEIPGIHEIPEIPHPEVPDPQPEMQVMDKEIELAKEQELPKTGVFQDISQNEKDFDLEELENVEPQPKRRKMKSRIIDRHIKLSTNFLRSRIENNAVELRCMSGLDDVVQIRVPTDILFGRPAHAGAKIHSGLGCTLTSLFRRNLDVVQHILPDQQMRHAAPSTRNISEHARIEEAPEVPLQDNLQPIQHEEIGLKEATLPVPDTVVDEDMADLPTQVIPTLSQVDRRSATLSQVVRSADNYEVPAKKPRHSYNKTEANKENISDNIPQEARLSDEHLSSMLQQAGLADLPQRAETDQPQSPKNLASRTRNGSDTSETPLGSLDRTRVSLGDSDATTDSARFIREQWGAEGTMIMVLNNIKAGVKPLDINGLLKKGPMIAGHKSIIAARCFTSVLKLKQHGFINLIKDPSTLQIEDITLGPRFDSVI